MRQEVCVMKEKYSQADKTNRAVFGVPAERRRQ
jgi:hypothetical protein